MFLTAQCALIGCSISYILQYHLHFEAYERIKGFDVILLDYSVAGCWLRSILWSYSSVRNTSKCSQLGPRWIIERTFAQ